MKAWVLWQVNRCDEALVSLNNISKLPSEAYKLLAVIHVCRGDGGAAEESLRPFMSRYPDWRISDETELQSLVWLHDVSLDRWLSELISAGMPDT